MSAADWKPYDVPGLARLLSEQPTDAGNHAMAWQHAYETLTDQRQRLLAGRAALTEAWPEQSGGAAAAFYAQVDSLADALAATAENAVKAHGALTGIVTAVDGATAKVDTLHQAWQRDDAAIGAVVPTGDWTQPLNNQAHNAMDEADAAIAEHATQLNPPVPYEPSASFEPLTPIAMQPNRTTGTVSARPTGQAAGLQYPSGPVLSGSAGRTAASSTGISAGAVTGTAPTNGGRTSRSTIGFGEPTPHLTASRGSSHEPTAPIASGEPENVGAPRGAVDDPAMSFTRANTIGGAVEPGGSENDVGLLRRAGLGTDVDPFEGSHATMLRGGASNAARSVGVNVGTDGGGGSLGQEGNRTAMFRPGAPDERAPYGGVLAGAGSVPSSAGGQGNQRHHRQLAEWPMPIGVPAVIEAVPELPANHDPGPGVIGIDR